MTKKRFRGLLCGLLSAAVIVSAGAMLTGCSDNKDTESVTYSSYKELSGKKAAMMQSSCYVQPFAELMPDCTIVQYNSYPDMTVALQSGKVEAVISDEGALSSIAAQNDDITMLGERVMQAEYAIAMNLADTELQQEVNSALKELYSDGSITELENRWLKPDENGNYGEMPEYKLLGGKGKLVLATTGTATPYSFMQGDRAVGYDVEVCYMLCERLGYSLEVQIMDFAGILGAVSSGKADLGAANITYTRERAQNVLFSDPIAYGDVCMLVRTENAPHSVYTSLSDFAGTSIGSTSGTTFYSYIDEKIENVNHQFFNDISGMYEALHAGKLSAVVLDEPVARHFVAMNKGLRIFEPAVDVSDYACTFAPGSPLKGKVDAVLKRFMEDGTLDELNKRWFGTDESLKVIPELSYKSDFDGSAGTIHLGTDALTEPMSYIGADGTPTGFEIELMTRVAYELNMKLDVAQYDFSGMLNAVASGKVDAACCAISITEERKQSVDFSIPYYTGGIVLVTEDYDGTAGRSFFESLAQSFESTFVTENRWQLILQGLLITVLITVGAAFFGTILGVPICALRMSKSKILSGIAKAYIAVFQGLPIVVLLMILYYVVFGKTSLDAVVVAIIGFSIMFSAYVCEMMRTGISTIDKGQLEAAYAMGFTRLQTFRKIILPQAARRVIPLFRGEFVSTMKSTSIVGYIAIQDLTKMSDIIRSRTYEAFFPLIVTAVIYIVISRLLIFGLTMIERRLDPDCKKRRRDKSEKADKLDIIDEKGAVQ